VDELVEATLGKREAPEVAILCVDDSPVSNEPDVHRGWQRVKVKASVNQPKERQSRRRLGALDLESQRVYGKQAPRENALNFIACLHPLPQSFADHFVVWIGDHFRIPHRQKVKVMVSNTCCLELEPLAPYRPGVPSARAVLALAQETSRWLEIVRDDGRSDGQNPQADVA